MKLFLGRPNWESEKEDIIDVGEKVSIVREIMKSGKKGKDLSDLLSQLSQGASHFKGCWRNLHGFEFPSARRYFVLHAKPSDFTDAGTHEAICDPTSFTSVCQRTDQYPARNSNLFARFHPLSCERGIPARKC